MHVSNKRTKGRAALAAGTLCLAISASATAGAAEEKTADATLLPETVVTATRTPTPSAQIGSSISVITGAELERRQITFVSDGLRYIPGVAVNRTSGFGSLTAVRIRGAEANQTLVLIDGVKVNDPALGSEFDFGNLLTSDIERIEVLRGPQSVLYGSDAVGGVINIITKRGKAGPRVTASTEYGSFDTYQSTATVSGGTELYDFALNGVFFDTDGVSAASEKNGNTEKDGDRNKTVQGQFGVRPLDILEVRLNGRYQNADLDTDAFTTIAVDDPSFSSNIERFGQAQVKLDLLDRNWEHIVSGSLFENRLKSGGGAFGGSSTRGTRRSLGYQTNLSLETPDYAEAAHTFSLGVSNDRERVRTNSSFSSIDRRLETTSIYGLYQVGLWDRLFLTGGGRHDYNDFFPDSTTYRVTGAFLIPEIAAKVHASGGTAVKNPTVFEMFGFTPTFTGNPDLRPERSDGFDVGVEKKFFGDRVVADATFFHTKIEDLIVGFGNTAFNQEGSSTATGVELSATAEIIDGLDVTATYTWMKTSDSNNEKLLRRPRNAASLNVNYGFLENRRANVNVGLIYNGEQTDVAFGPTRRVVLDDYVLLNIALSYQVTDYLQIYGRGENLLNQDYEEVFSFGTPGIAGYGGIRVSFEPLKLVGLDK